MAGARPRNVAAVGTDFILCIGYLRVAADFSGLSPAGEIPVSHAFPAKHCGTLGMADNKSQIL
jgi:hypothetical protein